jgi:hypothetical protein
MGVVDTLGLSLSQFSLVTGFFEGTRENVLHTFRDLVGTRLKFNFFMYFA